MKKMLILFMILILISTIILSISYLISKKKNLYMEKTSPYECGFMQMKKQRTNFNMRFFQIAIIFLVFDAEICLLIPTPNSLYSNFSSGVLITFIIIILVSTIFEWLVGSLSWMK